MSSRADRVETGDGRPVQNLVIAVDDMAMTVGARIDFLSADSLDWLISRCAQHATDCEATKDYPAAAYYRALAMFCQSRKEPEPGA